MTDEAKHRKACRHKGQAWLHLRGRRAGLESGRVRLAKVSARAEFLPSKTRAYLVGYIRGYRAAYKRHYEYWQRRRRHEARA